MTEVRRGRCQAPEKPPPSIVDYRPKSTVVAAEHLVPKAKFPVVDIHNHTGVNAENMAQLIKEMDALNLRVMVNLSGGSGDRLRESVQFIRNSPYKDRFRLFANVNWNGAGTPEWRQKEVAALRQAVADGAIGLKVFKGLGLSNTKADGSRLTIDDPDLDPIWQVCAELNIPVLIHTADPEQFFATPDNHNERWLEMGIFPGRAYPQDRFPSFETLAGERDRMFARNPKTRYIAAHFGWHGNDFGRAARMLDKMPNVYFEVGAVLYEFGRQPRAAREFFLKYSGPRDVRQGRLRRHGVSVLLARLRDDRRVLRLLPELSRVLEAVRHGPAGRDAEEAVLPERAQSGARIAPDGLVGRPALGWLARRGKGRARVGALASLAVGARSLRSRGRVRTASRIQSSLQLEEAS